MLVEGDDIMLVFWERTIKELLRNKQAYPQNQYFDCGRNND